MAQVRQHLNAKQTPATRRAMVDFVVVDGWSVSVPRWSHVSGRRRQNPPR